VLAYNRVASAAGSEAGGRTESASAREGGAAERGEEVVAREPRPRRRVALARDPEDLFWRGYRLYWQRRYADALDFLDAAVELRGNDARFWYYKALAERALGEAGEAAASVRRANALREQNSPPLDLIGVALERVQGPDRRFLNGPLNPAAAD
jgi:tetratricopeptide (TPR) repeat protein